ncbi:SRPBCC family protein [Nocardioides plantarum]|uniref:SRPBCC family protein n=1 Tax=Nocardioides plantarum TaxID=29299 RepID=A0ABV5KG98_9ACTN|nr:SRPBCC family protein [Nocardioides plantarum]
MADTQHDELEASTDIDAPPAAVWALVTDVPRMASWSPQVVHTRVKGGVVRQGARFSNLNHQGPLLWPTAGRVVRFEPHRDFAFRIRENRVVWSFELTDNGRGGTTLTQRREVPHGISQLSLVMTRFVLGGVGPFTRRLERGMQETLARVKAEAESA